MITLEYIGTITIEPDLVLTNPKMQVVKVVDYDIETNMFSIEVHFWETLYKHSRTYTTVNSGLNSLSLSQVFTFVGTHPILSQFTIIA